jgi:hypothetical protein
LGLANRPDGQMSWFLHKPPVIVPFVARPVGEFDAGLTPLLGKMRSAVVAMLGTTLLAYACWQGWHATEDFLECDTDLCVVYSRFVRFCPSVPLFCPLSVCLSHTPTRQLVTGRRRNTSEWRRSEVHTDESRRETLTGSRVTGGAPGGLETCPWTQAVDCTAQSTDGPTARAGGPDSAAL